MSAARGQVGDSLTSKGTLTLALAIGLATLLFAVPALYNGFPFTFYDTSSYLFLSFHPMRTPFYSLFILLFHWKISLWPVILVQGLLLAHLLYLTMRVAFGAVDLRHYLVICLVLAVCTSLPWFTGQIMPDIFTSVAVLASFLLAIGLDRLQRLEVAYVFLLLAGAVTLHLSNVPLTLGLLLVVLAYKLLFMRGALLRPAPFALQAGAIALGVAGLVLANTVMFGHVGLSAGGKAFLVARSVVDGPGRQYLEESCPEKHYRLCDYLDKITDDSDHFLWDPDGPIRLAGGVEALAEETDAIFTAAFERYPGWHLRMALDHVVTQLFLFSTASELISLLDRDFMHRSIEVNVPRELETWRSSKQNRNTLPLATLALIGNVTAAISFPVAVAVVVVLWRRRDWTALALLVMVAAALVGNAMISGAVSGPHDRYQSRVIWLLTFVALAGALACFRKRPRQAPADGSG